MIKLINVMLKGICIFWIGLGIIFVAFPVSIVLWTEAPMESMINMIEEIAGS